MGVADLDLGGATPGLHDIILDVNTIAYIRSQAGLPAASGSSGTGGAAGGGGSTGGGHWQYPVAPHATPANPYDVAYAAHDEVVSLTGISHFVV